MPSKSFTKLQSMVGRSVETVEGLRVEPGKVEEFARAITDENPIYRDASIAESRGFDGVAAPLTFTRTADFPRYRPAEFAGKFGFDLGFSPTSTLHGEQEYKFHRPLSAGDVLSATATLQDVYRRTSGRGGEMTFAVIEEVFEDGDSDPVVTVRSTYIETNGVSE